MWFKKKDEASDGPTPTPVTFERIGQSLSRLEWHYEADETYYRAFFDGYATVFECSDSGNLFSVYSWSSGYFDGEHRFPEALQWASQWNANTLFGTARPYMDEDKDVIMRVDTSFLCGAGLTDEQLDEFLQIAVACNVQAIEKYVGDLGLERREAPQNNS
ncbi:YbjN domain-containing protein [Schaalia sp. Marseille-Q2122]|uniref:YbjN domain-containing protein n=1 Tax=Schaalia sp. Marseille-Q2122 TaxID=2736604 RepID=UPI001588C1FE|nr:YbjN domain-containing protein [Schaalia sp. Marseille-Q2122]